MTSHRTISKTRRAKQMTHLPKECGQDMAPRHSRVIWVFPDLFRFVSSPLEILVSLILLWASSSNALAQCADIPKTIPSGSFVVSNNGTVLDQRTDLMWKRCSEGLSGEDCSVGIAEEYYWDEALRVPGEVNVGGGFAGYDNWRLPNIKELATLVEDGCSFPSIDSVVFPNSIVGIFTAAHHWSSTPFSEALGRAWGVKFTAGEVNYHLRSDGNRAPGNVRLVRNATENDLPTLKLATFNIQVFGPTKMGKDGVVAELVDIIKKYDVVAVQEIKNAAEVVPYQFLDAINDSGGNYGMALSERGGNQADDANFQEQYAYYYNKNTINLLADYGIFPDDANDLFQREPYAARFSVLNGGFSFVLLTVHTSPSVAVTEIKAMNDAILWAQSVAPLEDDFIALGDFNQGCTYSSPEDLAGSEIVTNYTYIVPDSADTNFSTNSQCAYDRIVITNNTDLEYTDNWGIDTVSGSDVSDHFPVWAEFSATEQ